jgi:hypothetical protein
MSSAAINKQREAKRGAAAKDSVAAREEADTQSKLSARGLLHMYLSGTVVGVANAAMFHPVDSIRIRYFFLPRSKKTVHMDDIRGVSFWKGISFNMFSTALKQMAFYPTQELIKHVCIAKGGMSEERGQFFSSMFAGMVLGLLAAPINVIKVPLQSGVNANFTVRQICGDVYRERGLLGFYRGGLGIVLRDTVWSMAYFPMFGLLRKTLSSVVPPSLFSSERDPRSVAINSLSSVTASMMAMLASYPFDSSRLYRQKFGGQYGFWHGFLKSFQPSSANYRSLAASLIRVPLATAFSHTLYLFLEHK